MKMIGLKHPPATGMRQMAAAGSMAITLFAMVSLADGTARINVRNVGTVKVELDDGTVIVPGSSAFVEVQAGQAGEILGVPYRALEPGDMATIRVVAPKLAVADASQETGAIGSSAAPIIVGKEPDTNSSKYDEIQKRAGTFPDLLVRECPKKVRIEVRSRSLGPERSDATDIAKGAFPAARHDHVFVYNAGTGELIDDIGWSDDYGGSGFRDYGNFSRYGTPIRTLEIPGNIYYDVRNAFVAASRHFGYQLFNDATIRGPVAIADALLSIGWAEMKCVSGFSKEKILETLLCSIFAMSEGKSASDKLTQSGSYNHPGFDSKNKKLLVNCQLWARMFLDALEDVAAMAQLEDVLLNGVAPASTKTEEKQQKQFEQKEEKHPCIPCWAGDLVGTCSDPKCPNYGNPHRTYKGGGLPAFGKR